MSKLFKLKEWLTLDEAANHISSLLGEPATVADLYRFALDGHLTLSIDFVNRVHARKGKWVTNDAVQFVKMDVGRFFNDSHSMIVDMPLNHEIRVSDDKWIALDTPVVSIGGIWDLTMAGAERLDVEHYYQQLTSGLEVTLETLDGAFVQQGDVVCQLQEDYDDNEFQLGSKAQLKSIKIYLEENSVSEDREKEIKAEYKANRETFLEKRKEGLNEMNYFPSGGLVAHDGVLLIRTNEITRFIQSLEETPVPTKELTSKERNSLLVLIGALCKELDINPATRGVATSIVRMTEIAGTALTDDTVRKILRQIDEAVSLRSK